MKLNANKSLKFSGVADGAAKFLQNEYLYDEVLWAKFVDLYRSQIDGENNGWRGEYWGKMMRGAVLVCDYTKDEKLYKILTSSVRDMLTVMEDDGRISSYSKETEFDAWDLWGRKYVILALEYYLDICDDDDLKEDIISFISRAADHILMNIGPDKKDITRASRSWFGLNSSSILEPMARLYRLTKEKRYFDFCTYIVERGGTKNINVFELAYENKIYPYQYGVSKAYEMTSCFEGLLEYYELTGIEKYKTAVLNYARAVIDSEISIIGCSGMAHELFDHTRTRQTVKCEGGMQETCVTVTLMKFFARLLTLTKDSIYADIIEKAFYNAYLGALNTENSECKSPYKQYPDVDIIPTRLPFDSYSPLTPGKRGSSVGGFQFLPDFSYYGCCACIGAAGVGVFLQNAVIVEDGVVTVNFFERGKTEFSLGNENVILEMDTDYPASEDIKIKISVSNPTEFSLKVRNPSWADMPVGYTEYKKVWHNDSIEVSFSMPIKFHYPEYWENDLIYTDLSKRVEGYYTASPVNATHEKSEENYVAITIGPLTLAADSRTGKSAFSRFSFSRNAKKSENPEIAEGIPCIVKMEFTDEDGNIFYLVDYASAGRDWETDIAAWLPTK